MPFFVIAVTRVPSTYYTAVTRCIMKRFKAAVPTVCYTVLLLAIALLSFLIAGKSGVMPTSAKSSSSPEENKDLPLPAQEPEAPLYDDVFPRKAISGKQKIYGEGNVRLHDVIQTPVDSFVILTSECEKGDVGALNPVVAVVKINENNDLISSYRIAENEKYITAQQTPVGIALVTQNSDGKRDSVHIVGYDLLGESKFDVAPGSARVIPTEKSFVLFITNPDGCVAYTLRDGKLLFQNVGKYSLVDLMEYEDNYVLFCIDEFGASSVLITDKKSLTVTEKQRVSADKILFVKPTQSGFLTVEKGNGTYARIYSANMKERVKETDLGAVNVKNAFRADVSVVLPCENSGYILLHDDLTTELLETSNKSLLDIVNINGSERFLFKDENDNLFFDDRQPFTQATKAVVLPARNNTLTVVTERTDKYSFIEIADLPY